MIIQREYKAHQKCTVFTPIGLFHIFFNHVRFTFGISVLCHLLSAKHFILVDLVACVYQDVKQEMWNDGRAARKRVQIFNIVTFRWLVEGSSVKMDWNRR